MLGAGEHEPPRRWVLVNFALQVAQEERGMLDLVENRAGAVLRQESPRAEWPLRISHPLQGGHLATRTAPVFAMMSPQVVS